MIWLLYPILLIPAFALAWVWHFRRPSKTDWPIYYKRIGFLFAVGVFAAAPFVSRGGLGSGEAYNYSLATADAVLQFRQGVLPVLVGQTEYAFNGRIHPLRTAPYMANFAGLIDLITFHQLTFWGIQNLTVALSLIGGVFSAYANLRRATRISPATAVIFAGAYILAPGVLAPAYSMDLYMTVMTVPFIPVVIGACVRTLKGDRCFAVYALLGAGLAATWLAHPPVAYWLTVGVVVLQAPLLLAWKFRSREFGNACAGGALCLLLSAFVFVSALSIHDYKASTEKEETATTIHEVARVFNESLQPVSPSADRLSDFQLGYTYAGILAVAGALAIARRNGKVLLLLGVAGFYLALTLPIPWLNAWLWTHAPAVATTLTSHWPMQRVYLLITAISVFALASTGGIPALSAIPVKLLRDATVLALLIVALWTTTQAWHFIRRGFATQLGRDRSEMVHRPENINLTVTSYAFFKPPPTFVNGPMDPAMEFKLLAPATAEPFSTNWSAADAFGETVQQGLLHTATLEGEIAQLTPDIRVRPGAHFRVDFQFQTAPLKATLQLLGAHTSRDYPLPEAGQIQGFGMMPANSHAISLWTTHSGTEQVTAQLVGPEVAAAGNLHFAEFKVRPITANKLPVQVESWVPLRLRVNAPQAGYVETPRLYVDGYFARVNGEAVRVQASPDGLAMVPVPAGASSVTVAYQGPPAVRIGFWTTFFGWIGFFGIGALNLFRPTFGTSAASNFRRLFLPVWRQKYRISFAAGLIVISAYGFHRWSAYRDAAGPLQIRLLLPRSEIGRSQPLLTTGKPNEGTFIFMMYVDPTHLRIGMDVWGVALWRSEPIPVDYFAEHEFIVSSGALYPPDHPRVKGLPHDVLEKLRNRITVSLDGKLVLDQPVFSYSSKISEVTVGESRIGVSNTEAKFAGKILAIKRLPIPRP